MFVGSLVCHKGFLGIVTEQKVFPHGPTRNQVAWVVKGKIAKGLWWDSSDLELVNAGR